MSIEYALFLLGCLEGIAVLAIAWIVKNVGENGRTLSRLDLKTGILCDRTKDHESRIRQLEGNHNGQGMV